MSKNTGRNNVSARTAEELKAGYVRDYISGKPVKAAPEKVQAVQVFARRLFEDYAYSKSQIQTRPQFRLCKPPSYKEKCYTIDIAVFRTTKKPREVPTIVVQTRLIADGLHRHLI